MGTTLDVTFHICSSYASGSSPSSGAPSFWCYCQLGLLHFPLLPFSAPCLPPLCLVDQPAAVCQCSTESYLLVCPTGTFLLLIHASQCTLSQLASYAYCTVCAGLFQGYSINTISMHFSLEKSETSKCKLKHSMSDGQKGTMSLSHSGAVVYWSKDFPCCSEILKPDSSVLFLVLLLISSC